MTQTKKAPANIVIGQMNEHNNMRSKYSTGSLNNSLTNTVVKTNDRNIIAAYRATYIIMTYPLLNYSSDGPRALPTSPRNMFRASAIVSAKPTTT